jgi:hypothetical protein
LKNYATGFLLKSEYKPSKKKNGVGKQILLLKTAKRDQSTLFTLKEYQAADAQ